MYVMSGIRRDSNGEITSYTSDAFKGRPEDSFAVLIAKYEARFSRLESRTEDAHSKLDDISRSQLDISKQVSKICQQWHEMLQTFHDVLESNRNLSVACKENSNDALKIKTSIRVVTWATGIIGTLTAIVVAFGKTMFKNHI